MAYTNELKKLVERFPNKNVGCGNPDAKILVVTQKTRNEKVDFKYLRKLFEYLLCDRKGKKLSVLDICYYVVFDEELLKDSFFNHFQAIVYTLKDGNQLYQHDPTKMFDMFWIAGCTFEDGAIRRLYVAHSKAEGDKPERMMFCTYSFEKTSKVILKNEMILLNLFFYLQEDVEIIYKTNKEQKK